MDDSPALTGSVPAPDSFSGAKDAPGAVWILYALGIFAMAAGLYLASLHDYLLFHSLAEIFAITIGVAIFIIAWNCRDYMNSGYLLLIGVTFMFISVVDVFHMLSYKGMGVFPGYDANLPTQFWIAARYMEAAALLIAPFYIARKPNLTFIGLAYFAVTAAVLILAFSRHFPDCYVAGQGLTAFKRISEYVISLMLAAAAWLLVAKRRYFDRDVLYLILAAIVLTIFSELSFSDYAGVYDFMNLLGHYFRIAAFFLFYLALVRTALKKPFSLLFREVGARNAQLAAASRRLKESNKELEAFSYTLSHDLRAPLMTIDGYTDMVMDEYGSQLGEAGLDELRRVRRASGHMGELIEDMLILCRAGSGKMDLHPVDLSACAERLAAELKVTSPERRVVFKIQPGVIVDGDESLLSSAMENLIRNSWKFTGKHAAGVIEFGAFEDNGRTVYFVRDDGAGFDMRYAVKLFEPFQRLHADAEFSGTGVGLATVKRIISRHGGEVWAEGAPEKGATFYFTLAQRAD